MPHTSKNAKFHNPPNKLREKVGYGGLEPTRLERAEAFIEENELDFTPYAESLIKRLDAIIKDLKSGDISHEEGRGALIRSIMEIKANGGMFKFMLLSEIADVILNFLENIEETNDDAMNIIDAHQNTVKVIVGNQLTGSGGREGKAISMELYAACNRYYEKYKVKTKG